MRATIEDIFLARVAEAARESGELRLRCAVPEGASSVGGLTVYGDDTGRHPIGPTVVIECRSYEARR